MRRNSAKAGLRLTPGPRLRGYLEGHLLIIISRRRAQLAILPKILNGLFPFSLAKSHASCWRGVFIMIYQEDQERPPASAKRCSDGHFGVFIAIVSAVAGFETHLNSVRAPMMPEREAQW